MKIEADGTQTYYIYGLGFIGEETNGQYRTYHFEFRGSTVALTDENGEVVERFGYSPFGELVVGDPTTTPFLFNGQYGVMTDGNELYYMRARFYSPLMRRFVNPDVLLGGVVEGQTLNRFAFVNGNPVSFVDPFGLEGQCASWECAFYGAPLIEQDIKALSGAGVRLCCRPAAIAANVVSHCWIRTGKFNMGLGGNPDIIPGEAYESLYIAGTYVIDHSKDYPFNGCEMQPNVSETCVNDILSREIGTYQGRFSFIAIDGFNNCQAYAQSVFDRCKTPDAK